MRIVQQLNTALVGRYVIDGVIGAGGMATVYRAHDVRHGRLVALKVLDPDLGATLGAARFLAEIRVTAHLQHPNLLPLFDSGEADGLLYYVMPFVDGESLRRRLERERQLPIDHAVHIAASIASALEYAHAHGVIHRDLKPENILMQGDEPMVADFGIALAVSRAGSERSTQAGLSLGTPQYMSPEQATADRAVDRRSDIYSLAAVLYEMLAGCPPHTGTSVQAIIAKVVNQEVPSVRVTRPKIPDQVARAISRGLEKLPADRWTSARQFADALTDQRHVELRALGDATQLPQSRRRAMSLISLGLIPLVLGVAVAAWPRTQPPRQIVWFDLGLRDGALPDGEIALSSDGSMIAWAGRSQSLYVRRLDELAARSLVGSDGGSCPSFSPDNRWLLFVSGRRLMKIPVAGGSPIIIVDPVEDCGVWTDRDEILFERGHEVFRVSAEGGRVSALARVDTSKRIRRLRPAQPLPGGASALISVSENVMRDWRVGVVSIPSGKVARLTPETGVPAHFPQYSNGYLIYEENRAVVAVPFSLSALRTTGPPVKLLQDSIEIFATSLVGDLAYVARLRDTVSLVSVNAAGQPQALASKADASGGRTWTPSVLDTAYFSWPRLSPDGKRIALELTSGPFRWDVWIYDIAARTLSPLTRNFSGVRPAGWSADGQSVFYMQLDSASLSAPTRLVVQPWDGSTPARELMRLPTNAHDATIVTPNGYVAFTVSKPGHPMDIWLARLDPPQAARPFVVTEGIAKMARFSPDGMRLAYVSDESGRTEVYVRPVPGPASRLQVSVDGGTQPVWSADGRALYYRGPEHMMRAGITSGVEFRVSTRDTLFRDDFARHTNSTPNYDVFPGGKDFLMIRSTSHAPHVAVIRNWPELVRQRAAVP